MVEFIQYINLICDWYGSFGLKNVIPNLKAVHWVIQQVEGSWFQADCLHSSCLGERNDSFHNGRVRRERSDSGNLLL